MSYCRFHLAVDQGKEEPLWLSVVAWRLLATQVEKYVKKGSLVLVAGRLSVDTYTDRQNQKQSGIEIVALDVRFLDQKPKGDPPLKTNSILTTQLVLLPADMHMEEVLSKSVGTAAVERRGGGASVTHEEISAYEPGNDDIPPPQLPQANQTLLLASTA